MADASDQDRTEAATPKRRQEVAEKGQGPRSREVPTAFLLMASAGALAVGAPELARSAVDLFVMSVSGLPVSTQGATGSAQYLSSVGWFTFRSLAPLLLSLAGVALIAGVVQTRGVLSLEPLKPQWSRIDPLKRAKQIWGWAALAELVKSILKLLIVGAVVWLTLRPMLADLSLVGQTSPAALLSFMARHTVRLLLNVGGAYLAIALADYLFQIWQHERQIRMTRDELKREVKESEGDQIVKVRRRTIARQIARRRMMHSVREADVVVVNPTHIAVALKYDPEVAPAPIVLALGERKVAERIRDLAREAGVPMVENKPLARALLATAKVGAAIPMDLFVAVAEVLAFVYRMKGATGYAHGARR